MPDAYDTYLLNEIVLALPLAEAHAALDEVELESLPCLGEGLTLNAHMQANFFNVIGAASRELWETTKPFLIARKYLERLEGWRDWRTLAVYLEQEHLEPVMVFRNTPMSITGKPGDYYVADIRVLCGREQPFVWSK